jgi:peptidoglycan DL-endopeptidase CwlO
MSDTAVTFPSPSDSPAPHIRRRRHAAQSTGPSRARSAGVAGGVIGTTLALSGMAVAGSADAAAVSDQTATGSIPVVPALSTAGTSAQAVQALGRSAADLQLDAARDHAAAVALQQAQRAKAAETARKAAAARAARFGGRLPLLSVSGRVGTVLGFLTAQLGKAYVYGATGPNAYDCSGLTKAAYATIGVDLPRTAAEQSLMGSPVPLSAIRPGDLLFWGGTGSAYHVAVYVGGGQYLDAANPGKGIVIQKMAYYMPSSAVRVA